MIYLVMYAYYSDWEIYGYFTNREDAEKYIEKTKLILEIHSRGLREKDFSLSQLHELQNYLERTEK